MKLAYQTEMYLEIQETNKYNKDLIINQCRTREVDYVGGHGHRIYETGEENKKYDITEKN